MKKVISLILAVAVSAGMAMTVTAEELLQPKQTAPISTEDNTPEEVTSNTAPVSDGEEGNPATVTGNTSPVSDGEVENPATVTGNTGPESETETFTLVLQIDNPEMVVNGERTEIDPGEGTVPVIVNERTLVPVSAIVKAMGGTAEWDEETRTATLALDGDTIKLVIGSTTAYFNDTAVELDVTPEIINDRTMLPIRFIAESFKFGVLWDGDTQCVIMVKEIAPKTVTGNTSPVSDGETEEPKTETSNTSPVEGTDSAPVSTGDTKEE